MKWLLMLPCLLLTTPLPAAEGNPRIDYGGFLALAQRLQPVREARRISEEVFLRMAAEEGVVILDTRSRGKFEKIHVKGAKHLSFSDLTEGSLSRLIPDKQTRILIYCNNNFENEPVGFPAKQREVALNVPTFINLHAYGYTNVFELKPLLDIKTTKIPMAGSSIDC